MTPLATATVALVFVCAGVSLALAVIDVASHRLPNRLVFAFGGTATAVAVLSAIEAGSARPFIEAVVAGAVLFVLYYLLHRGGGGMGGGDVKLAAAIGLFTGPLGWQAPLLATALGFVSGGLVAVVMIAVRCGDRRTRIPFGPFMLAGAWVAVGGSWVAS
ncbi:A24 family peptidase [Microbacterium sp. 2P01SA-2]|uniref:prepilin peptidase n=1 Tax=unclassified Microbacterium TaxID=2609290 RepID=UPI0039A2962B